MKTYEVSITWHYTEVFTVTAEDEEEAIEIARESEGSGDTYPESDDGDTTVTLIEEKTNAV